MEINDDSVQIIKMKPDDSISTNKNSNDTAILLHEQWTSDIWYGFSDQMMISLGKCHANCKHIQYSFWVLAENVELYFFYPRQTIPELSISINSYIHVNSASDLSKLMFCSWLNIKFLCQKLRFSFFVLWNKNAFLSLLLE